MPIKSLDKHAQNEQQQSLFGTPFDRQKKKDLEFLAALHRKNTSLEGAESGQGRKARPTVDLGEASKNCEGHVSSVALRFRHGSCDLLLGVPLAEFVDCIRGFSSQKSKRVRRCCGDWCC